MIVQIYEIQTPQECEAMIDLGVDHIGSVITSADAWQQRLIKDTISAVQADGRKSSVIPLFSDPDLISEAITYYKPDIIHFCDNVDNMGDQDRQIDALVEVQTTIRERFPHTEIMRSIPIGQYGYPDLAPSLYIASQFEAISDWFLTDTLLAPHSRTLDAEQPVPGYVGITGVPCDWDIARQLVNQSSLPVILAGGLGPDNVAEAIAHVHPAGVDSCTQTNRVDSQGAPVRFQKDVKKVKTMVARAKHNVYN